MPATTMPASSSAISGVSASYQTRRSPRWSPSTTAGRCGEPSRPRSVRSTSISGPGRWSGSRAPWPDSRRPASTGCSMRFSARTEASSTTEQPSRTGMRQDDRDGLPMKEQNPGGGGPGGGGPGGVVQAGAGSRLALPCRARVVIIGGGVIGTSVAYHLTLRGLADVLLLEQGQLSCGTTWHAAGLVGQLRASESGTKLVQYSTQLYDRLEEETGLATGFRRCGGVTVARTADRMMALRRTAATAEAFGLECELISPQRAAELYPIMETCDLVGAIWLPGDGRANPTDLTAALARGARMRGVTIRERTRVTGIAV